MNKPDPDVNKQGPIVNKPGRKVDKCHKCGIVAEGSSKVIRDDADFEVVHFCEKCFDAMVEDMMDLIRYGGNPPPKKI